METLRLRADSLDAVPEGLRELYDAQPDGGYKLRLDEPDAITRALKAEREGRRDAEREAREAREGADIKLSEAMAEQRRIGADRDRAVKLLETMKTRALETQLTAAAKASGLHNAAIADFVRAAKERFALSDNGELVGREGNAQSLVDFAESAKELSPHWFPATGSGGGASSDGRSTGNPAATITRAGFERLPPQQRAAVLRRGIKLTD